jgi:hypothetical protein
VERVQFFLDGKLLTTKRSLPFSLPYTFTESPGMHQLKVTAKDGEGNEGEDEVSINVQ